MNQEELDAMEKALEEPEAGEAEVRTDPPATGAPATSTPATEAPGTTSLSTDAPSTSAPSTEAPEDPRDKELRELREKVENLSTPKTKSPSTKVPSTEAPISDEDFLGDADLDDLSRDPKEFNKLLNKIYKKGLTDARTELKKEISLMSNSIPSTVTNTLTLQTDLLETRKTFYDENPDLVPWYKSVKTVMDELIEENPKAHYKELLPKVATEVRRRLNLKSPDKTNTNTGEKDNPPKLPKKKSGQRQQSNQELSNLEKDMDEMDKALGI